MDKLRILPLASVWGLLPSLALAQLLTVGPNTPGVTESVLLLEQPSPSTFPQTNYDPVFSEDFFVPYTAYGLENNYNPASTDCLHGCSLLAAPGLVPSFFDIHFNTPVSSVSVTLTSDEFNEAFIQVFNSSGALLSSCAGLTGGPIEGPQGCFSVLGSASPDGEIQTWQFAIAAPGISTVLASSFDAGLAAEPGPVSFVAEPATFGLLVLGLAGVGFARRKRSTCPGTAGYSAARRTANSRYRDSRASAPWLCSYAADTPALRESSCPRTQVFSGQRIAGPSPGSVHHLSRP